MEEQKAVTREIVLETKNLTKRFGGLVAVNDLSMQVLPATIHGLIGPNGAGKTTVINLLTGFYTPTEGNIYFYGKDISGLKSCDRAKLGMARTFQASHLFGDMTVLENVMMAVDNDCKYNLFDVLVRPGRIKREENELRQKAFDILEILHIIDVYNVPTRKLPYGKKRLVEIARALIMDPKFILLDEPSAGMNEEERAILSQEIINLKNLGYTILIVEHHMEMIMGICDEITVITFGKKIAHGDPETIQNDPEVIRAYLGGEFVVED